MLASHLNNANETNRYVRPLSAMVMHLSEGRQVILTEFEMINSSNFVVTSLWKIIIFYGYS